MDGFKDTRVRLRRLSGGPAFGGWFKTAVDQRLVVDLSATEILRVGEAVHVHAACGECEAEFDTVHIQTDGLLAAFAIPHVVRIEPRKEIPRFRNVEIEAALVTPDGELPATDIDVSEGGIGFTVGVHLDMGDVASIAMRATGLEETVEAECRHCRAFGDGRFHLGFKFVPKDRFVKARWLRYIDTIRPNSAGNAPRIVA